MKNFVKKSLVACTLSLVILGQALPVMATEQITLQWGNAEVEAVDEEPTVDFNGGRYTRAEFLEKYGRFSLNITVGDAPVTLEQFFDMFAVVLLHQYRLNEEQVAEWIANFKETGGISQVELDLLHYTNIERARVGVAPLALCPTLSMAARFKAEEMAEHRYFAHESPIYGNPTNISRELFGIEDMRSENLTRRISRQNTAFDLVQSWLGSPGHKANMLDPEHRYLGVGVLENVMGMGVNYDGTPILDRYASLGVQKFR